MSSFFPDCSLQVVTREHWSLLLPSPLKLLRVFRVGEVFFYIIFCLVVYYAFEAQKYSKLPLVNVRNDTAEFSAINPRFSAPIKLNGIDCTPFDLDIPKCNEEMLHNPSHCCAELFNKDSWPYESITSDMNYVLLFFLSLSFLVIRLLMWRFVYKSKYGNSLVSTCDKWFWILTFWDQYVGMLAASVYAGLMTNYIKLLIGAPRPCYYAFQIYSSIFESHRQKLDDTSRTAFVSGHASAAATIMSYVVIVFVADIQYFRDHQPHVAFGVTQLMLIPATVALWIGLTRIMDSWHFEVDVVCGWLVGIAASLYSYICVALYSRADTIHEAVIDEKNSDVDALNTQQSSNLEISTVGHISAK